MKRIIFHIFSGLALLTVASLGTLAHAEVHIGVGIYAPAPYYVEPPPIYYEPSPRYYSPPPPVYYGPGVIYQDQEWGHRGRWRGEHDRGRHRGEDHHGDEHD